MLTFSWAAVHVQLRGLICIVNRLFKKRPDIIKIPDGGMLKNIRVANCGPSAAVHSFMSTTHCSVVGQGWCKLIDDSGRPGHSHYHVDFRERVCEGRI